MLTDPLFQSHDDKETCLALYQGPLCSTMRVTRRKSKRAAMHSPPPPLCSSARERELGFGSLNLKKWTRFAWGGGLPSAMNRCYVLRWSRCSAQAAHSIYDCCSGIPTMTPHGAPGTLSHRLTSLLCLSCASLVYANPSACSGEQAGPIKGIFTVRFCLNKVNCF